ncbi:MAG: hypothetical protein AAFW46_18735, partial [Pseudomonadota bacterium]
MTASPDQFRDAPDLTAAVADLARDVGGFATEIRRDLSARDDRIERRLSDLERASADAPTLSRGADPRAPHAKAMERYLRQGDEDGLKSLPAAPETKALSVVADGGYL